MKQCDICLEEFNPNEETTCPKCSEEIALSHIARYHEQKERIQTLESAMQEFKKEYEDSEAKTHGSQFSWTKAKPAEKLYNLIDQLLTKKSEG